MKINNLLIDGNAIMYKYFFGFKDSNLEDIKRAASVNIFYKIQFLYKKYNIDNIIIVFDGKKSWRKLYTSDKNLEKITHKKYKAGRREKMTRAERKKIEEFDNYLSIFSEFLTTKTNIICLTAMYLEGDDLIAGYIAKFNNDNHVIYSSDKDFLQLINSINGTVTLVETKNDEERTLDEWNNDPKLFLFEKCIRGEGRERDNVQSSYPRLRKNKIIDAYNNDYIKSNIMNYEFVVEELNDNDELIKYEYKTKQLFEENKILMGLNNQPEYIKEIINKTIDNGIKNSGKFNILSFLKFCYKYDMNDIIKEKHNFLNILTKSYILSSSPLSPSF